MSKKIRNESEIEPQVKRSSKPIRKTEIEDRNENVNDSSDDEVPPQDGTGPLPPQDNLDQLPPKQGSPKQGSPKPFDFEELKYEDYAPEVNKVLNMVTPIYMRNLTELEVTDFINNWSLQREKRGDDIEVITAINKTGIQTSSDRRIKKAIEIGFTIAHPDYPKSKEIWEESWLFVTFISVNLGLDLGINHEVKKGMEKFAVEEAAKAKKAAEDAANTNSNAPGPTQLINNKTGQSVIYCNDCLHTCISKPQKKFGTKGNGTTMTENAEFCPKHSTEITWRLKAIAILVLGVKTKDELKQHFAAKYGDKTEEEFAAFNRFAKNLKLVSDKTAKTMMSSSEKADWSFFSMLRLMIQCDPSVFTMPQVLTYNANSSGMFTKIFLTLQNKDFSVYEARVIMREIYQFEGTNKWTNAPRHLNQKSGDGEKISPYYGGSLAIGLLEFLMQGIVLYGMTGSAVVNDNLGGTAMDLEDIFKF